MQQELVLGVLAILVIDFLLVGGLACLSLYFQINLVRWKREKMKSVVICFLTGEG